MKHSSLLRICSMVVLLLLTVAGKADAKPADVTNLSAVTEKYIAVLSWTPSPDADYYWIMRDGVKEDIQPIGTASSQTISNLAPGTSYTFTVIAWKNGERSDGVSITCRTKDNKQEEFDKGENIAKGKTCYASSQSQPASYAVDGDPKTRWESEFSDPQWFYVDLGSKKTVKSITILWEAAYAREYRIDVSNDANNWKTMYSTTTGDGDTDEIYVDTIVRYVRFYGTKRATNYGYSFFEFQIYSKAPASVLTTILVSPASVDMELGDKQQFTCTGYDQYGKKMSVTPTWNATGGGTINSKGVFTAETIGGPFMIEATDVTGTKGRAEVTIKPAIEFTTTLPKANTMITDTRRPTFLWNGCDGAAKYELYVNITRDDYDWTASGNLLDRYTKVGETTETQFTLNKDLDDRWTYKWYVVATDDDGTQHYSDTKVFSLYMPTVETVDDGVEIINGCRDLNKNGKIDDYENWRLPIEKRVNDLMSKMTIEEKAYQMFYNAQQFPISGWAFGPINESESLTLQSNAARTRLGIPYVASGDCIHGYKTTYPVQSTMAAARDLDMVYRCVSIQRMEQVGVGFRGTLAPLAEVGTKVLYDRIQEGCGEDADFAAAMTRAMVCALQGGPELNPKSVMVHTKHWPGEGAGGEGGIVYDGVTINYHMKPWYANKEANAGGVMPGYAGSSFLDPGGSGAGDSPAILRYLREVVGYDGIICTDWLPSGTWINAANAGSDVMGGADPGAEGFNMNTFINSVGEERINDAVRRILRTKFQLGIFEDPYGDPIGNQKYFHTAESHKTVVEAARRSIILLKNDNVLPIPAKLKAGDELLVAGPRANDQNCYSIWTSYFHHDNGAKTFLEGIQDRAQLEGINVVTSPSAKTKLAVICVGETGFTHRTGWREDKPYIDDQKYELGGQDIDKSLVKDILAQHIPTVLVYVSPRPYVLGWTNDECQAIVMAGRSGDGAGEGLAAILFGDYNPEGKLPWQLPRSMDQIGGLEPNEAIEQWDLPYDLGATDEERKIIRGLISSGLPVPPVYGDPLYQFGAGMTSFGLKDNTAPTAFQLTSPTNNTSISTLPTLKWQSSSDGETNIKHYEVWIDNEMMATTKDTSLKLQKINGNGTHEWYVVAVNWAGKRTRSSNTLKFTITDNQKPSAFNLLTPTNGSEITGDVMLVWESSADQGTGIAAYDIYLNSELLASVEPTTNAADDNIALNATVDASSSNGALTPGLIADGNSETRWQAATTGEEWIMLDLNDIFIVNKMSLSWEAAYAKEYTIEGSLDGKNWTTLFRETNSDGKQDDISNLKSACRYVKINCLKAAIGYGASLWEVIINGERTMNYDAGSLPQGDYTWTVTARDHAGNKTNANKPLTFKVANSPIPYIFTAEVSEITTKSAKVTLKAIDDKSGDITFTISADGNQIATAKGATDSFVSVELKNLKPATVYNLEITAKDADGNTSPIKVVSFATLSDPTAIENISNSEAMPKQPAYVYTLSGMRMPYSTNLPKGIYIINGKKVVIR